MNDLNQTPAPESKPQGDIRETHMQPDEVQPADTRPQGKKAKKAKKEKKKLVWWQEVLSWLGYLLAAVVIAGLIRGLLFEAVRVDGGSMLGTLHDKEVMLVTKPEVLMGKLDRGDIVICRFPKRLSWEKRFQLAAPFDITFSNHVLFVKRLVALPGDSVAVMNGRLYIDDQLVEESYIEPERFGGSSFPRYTLKENEYFVLGDNRANSQDSRYYGPISKDMIVGHPKLVILPLSQFRSLPGGQ